MIDQPRCAFMVPILAFLSILGHSTQAHVAMLLVQVGWLLLQMSMILMTMSHQILIAGRQACSCDCTTAGNDWVIG